MTDLKDFLEEFAKSKGKKMIGVNMWVWSHNDMMEFAAKYFDKEKLNIYTKNKTK